MCKPYHTDLDKALSLLRKLIEQGDYILNQLQSTQGLCSEIVTILREWIVHVTDQIFPIMPDQCPERTKLEEIGAIYDSCRAIIPGGIQGHIYYVLDNLRIAQHCVLAAFTADLKDLPAKTLADIEYDRTKGFMDIVRKHLITGLKGKEDGKTSGTALLHIYGRLYCYIDSMLKLNKPSDFLALSACLRAVLELYLDIRILEEGLVEHGVDKYFEFPSINKYRIAKNITEIRKNRHLVAGDQEKPLEKFLKEYENKENVGAENKKALWGKGKDGKSAQPRHWTNLDMISRLKKINDRQILSECLDIYYYCNLYIHSMYTDFPGRRLDDVHRFISRLYRLGGDLLSEATRIINDRFTTMNFSCLKNEISKVEQSTQSLYWGEFVKAGQEKGKHQ